MNAYSSEEIRTQLQAELYRRSFYDFLKFVAPLIKNINWDWNWHHEYLCDVLQDEIERMERQEKRKTHLCINVPPRTAKSLIVSVALPIWTAIRTPDISFANLSYSQILSNDHSNLVITILTHPEFKRYFNTDGSMDFVDTQKAKNDFRLNNGFTRIASSILGSVLGRGGNVIVLDDPNSPKKVYSEKERHNTLEAWKNSIASRLNNPSVDMFILVQQRLHLEDMTGYVTSEEDGEWRHICLPAELSDKVNPPELAARYDDGLLWNSDLLNRGVLAAHLNRMGSNTYANQLMQEVSAKGGNIIKESWVKTITLEKFIERCEVNAIKPRWDLFLDSAQTESKKNDPSGIMIATKIFNDVYVRKVIEKRLTMPDLLEALKQVVLEFNVNRIYVEPKSNGKDIVFQLKRQTRFNVIELPSPTTDKTERLNGVSARIEAGRLILIEDLSNDKIMEQLCYFPAVKHDEFCDLTGYAINKYLGTSAMNYATA
jgi:predicted phage terminase large subunit-like protein